MMKKMWLGVIVIGLLITVLALMLKGCKQDEISLPKIQNMYDKVELGMNSGDLHRVLGEPNEVKEGKKEGLISYYYLEGTLVIDIREGIVTSKQIYYTSNAKKNIMVGKEIKTESDDLEKKIYEIEEGMKFEKVVEILGEKYIQTLDDWFYHFTTYTWYDKNENHVEIEFDKNGRVDYIDKMISFSGDIIL